MGPWVMINAGWYNRLRLVAVDYGSQVITVRNPIAVVHRSVRFAQLLCRSATPSLDLEAVVHSSRSARRFKSLCVFKVQMLARLLLIMGKLTLKGSNPAINRRSTTGGTGG